MYYVSSHTACISEDPSIYGVAFIDSVHITSTEGFAWNLPRGHYSLMPV
jgi:hypothetical protein